MKKIVHVNGMSCAHCQAALEKALMGVAGVEKAEVNLLPFDQTFNYNVNCILSPTPGSLERDYGLIRTLYREP